MNKIKLLSLLSLLALVGCGGGDMGYVEGTITMDGKPLPNAIIEYFPKAGGGLSAGQTDAEGHYELFLGRSGKGAKVGEHLVQIRTTGGGTTDEDGYASESKELVPNKYNNQTELTAKVTSGKNTIDFDLDSEGQIDQMPTGY